MPTVSQYYGASFVMASKRTKVDFSPEVFLKEIEDTEKLEHSVTEFREQVSRLLTINNNFSKNRSCVADFQQ